MANIFDYLDWRGDLTLSERAFNEVDNLILAEICYVDFPASRPLALKRSKSRSARHGMPILLPIRPPIWVFCAGSDSGAGSKGSTDRTLWRLRLLGYVNRIDEETQTQFSAMTMLLRTAAPMSPSAAQTTRLSAGRKDFNMAFTPEIPAQRYAADYLQQAAAALAFRPLLVGRALQGRQSRRVCRGLLR